MDTLPYAHEAEVSLSPEELQVLRDSYLQEGEKPRPQTKFNYAWALVRSHSRSDQEEGIKLLHDIYRDLPSRRRECLYYIALGEYKLGNYRNARKYNETLLQLEARNSQAIALRTLIDEKVKSEGLVGMAIVGAAIAAVGVLTATLMKQRDR
ncbi:mitochondrial membrane protein [Geranomyces variabilis]|uniref:Mitochondrial fission 1 protein n=1 Tax=Geranomyces variabilis TaxID=109894 RepID=A0AAD5TQN6_9FUNG|nr:mitochondrial membrane protein [Geranomyces variabilis]